MFLSHHCLVFLFVFVSIFIPNNSQPTFLYNDCLDPSNITDEITFQSNLTALLDSLYSKSAIYSFFNDNISSSLYGLFLCRGDVSSDTCQNCTKTAIQQTKARCGSNTTAITWYDECMLRYSKDNFFGQPKTSSELLMYNLNNRTAPDQPDIDATSLMYPLIRNASLSAMLFNASEQGGGSQNNYGLVQCTRDLDGSSCGSCLDKLMDQARQCCQQKIGWRILSPSCYIRYENYRFFASPAAPPAGTAPAPAPAPGGGGGGNITTKIILATVIPATVVATMVCYLYHLCSRRERQRSSSGVEISGEILLGNLDSDRSKSSTIHLIEQGMNATNEDNNGEVHYFSLSTIKAATSNFSEKNKLGEGGFGPVYKGKLANGKEIAVKRLSFKSRQGLEEFKNEVMVIAKLQHRNLVRLLGCCLEENEKLLVYEYMINTSLDAFLFDSKKRKELDWPTRAKVVHGIARGILYLHEDSRLKIIHRDLKASNVLLDEEMNPKISDFGTARIFGGKQIEANTNRVVGTYGYMAPEYALEGLFSIKSDVYSFGILLLEILSGKKNSSFYEPGHAQSLLSYAWGLWNEGKGLELVDPEIVDSCQTDETMRWIHIGMLCVQDDPNDRPTMSSVVLMLGSNINLPTPSAPPFSVARFFASDQSSSTGHDAGFLTSSTAST